MMKVLLMNMSAYPNVGGVENSLNYIAKELIKNGYEVVVVSFSSLLSKENRFTHSNVNYITFPIEDSFGAPMRFLRVRRAVKKYIKDLLLEFCPDQIWSRSTILAYCVSKLGIPIPITQIYATTAFLHTKGTYFTKDKLGFIKRLKFIIYFMMDYPTMFLIEKHLVKYSKSIVFSNLMLEQLSKSYSKIKELQKIPPGLDHSVFSLENANSLQPIFEKEFPKLKEGYLLYVGRLSSAKNIDLLIEGYAKSEKRFPLVLVGEGSHKSFLIRKTLDLGIENKVFFVGKQSELLPTFYYNAKLSVLPSTIETFGQVITESMACGTPVLGFEKTKTNNVLNAFSEIVKDGDTGIVMSQVSSDNLAKSLNNFYANSYDLSSENCKKQAGNYSWDNFIKNLII